MCTYMYMYACNAIEYARVYCFPLCADEKVIFIRRYEYALAAAAVNSSKLCLNWDGYSMTMV